MKIKVSSLKISTHLTNLNLELPRRNEKSQITEIKKKKSLTNPTEIKKDYEGILQTYVNKLDNLEEMMNS